ncbi:protein kinase-like protein [Streptomyces sp. 3212.3]|nr:protein kinase-like protein [Streptomyces sp. 3212.3]
MRRVTGPCLVPLVAADSGAPQPWLATAYVPGPTLNAHISAHGPLSGVVLDALAAGTAAALAVIHATGVVHRDLKPGNVILSPAGPRVLDFGIAHALDETSITRTGAWIGTPGWSSPEQYRGEQSGPAADVFTWGALVAYAATGRQPFGAGRPDEVAYRVLSQEPDLTGVPAVLLPHVQSALSKSPGDRPSARELAADLEAVLANAATEVVGPGLATRVEEVVSGVWAPAHQVKDEDWPRPVSTSRRRGLKIAVLAAVTAAAVVAGGLTWTSARTNHNNRRRVAASAAPSTSAAHHAAAHASVSPSASAQAETPTVSESVETPIAQQSMGCVKVTYKSADGPSDCLSKDEVCALGAPWYTAQINEICGAAPIAKVYVDNTDVAPAPGCLKLESNAWVTGTASYASDSAPAAACSAFIDRTEIDNAGVPLKSCQVIYPGTRQTFLAILSTASGSITACLTANHGA